LGTGREGEKVGEREKAKRQGGKGRERERKQREGIREKIERR